MNIYLNPASTPPAVQLKVNSSPLASLRLKRSSVVPLSVTLMGVQEATDLRLGIKASYEGDLLALAWASSGTPTDNGLCFELALHVHSAALNTALRVGDAESTLSKLNCVAEFAWLENGELRVSDTINTTILNDIVRMAHAATDEPAFSIYPTPDEIATKEWVGEQNTAEVTKQLNAALVLPTTDFATPTGEEDSHYYYADIPARYVREGELASITLRGPKEILNAYSSPAYLSVWQHTGNDVWEAVAVSTNAVKLEANKLHEWKFTDAVLSGERIRFCLLETNANGPLFKQTLNIRSRVSLTSRWEDGHIFQPAVAHRLPELVIKMAVPCDRFAPGAHTADTVAHLTAVEHEGLTSLLSIKGQLLAAFPPTATTDEVDNTPADMEAYITPDEEETTIKIEL